MPSGWNSHKDNSYAKYDPCPLEGVMNKTEMMPVRWKSKKEARNTQHNHGAIKDLL